MACQHSTATRLEDCAPLRADCPPTDDNKQSSLVIWLPLMAESTRSLQLPATDSFEYYPARYRSEEKKSWRHLALVLRQYCAGCSRPRDNSSLCRTTPRSSPDAPMSLSTFGCGVGRKLAFFRCQTAQNFSDRKYRGAASSRCHCSPDRGSDSRRTKAESKNLGFGHLMISSLLRPEASSSFQQRTFL